MTGVAPDRLLLRSYPCVVCLPAADRGDPRDGHKRDIADCFEQARALVMERILGSAGDESGLPRLSLAFNTISYAEAAGRLVTCLAGAGVLSVAAGSVKIAMGLFIEGRCIAVADSVLIHAGDDGHRLWNADAEAKLSSLSWRYLGAPNG